MTWPQIDVTGRVRNSLPLDQVQSMQSPVRCRHCGDIYDLQAVTVTARYADCSVWQTPCCDKTSDDRREWGSSTRRRCYEEIPVVR